MDFTLTEEQSLLRDTARAYFAKMSDKRVHPARADQVWADVSAMGWLSIMVPEGAGGVGGSMIDGCLLARELGRGHARVPFTETAILGSIAFARDLRMLQQIAAGEVKIAFALQDDQAEPLRFQKREGGYILCGTKAFVTCAVGTAVFIVKAYDETGNVPALFAVSSEAPLAKLNAYPTLDGMGAVGITFDRLDVGGDACLALGDAGKDIIDQLELSACLAYSAEAVGLMEFLVSATREYTATREQFGQPLSAFQVVRHKLVEMYALTQLTESLVFQAVDTFNRLGASAESLQAVRAAFSYAARQGRRVGKEAIQLHGAIGTMDEVPIGCAFARLVAISQSCGGASLHERRYVEDLLSIGDTSRLWAL
ncbi:hypothetical protein AU467_18800 [Mesorhizobium loti]|uniref:Acyl-CoA dehydrogenase n=1 Tax=Rhizobium loti TaxID=381 RepID=A0A101KU09_RHILI|nr:hypothetical protein AU467_18800 [Mesorhizobium loti]